MTKQDIEKLVKPDCYQVFLLGSFCRFPVTILATHNWFVVNNKGKLSRWEVLIDKNMPAEKSWGHLHFNAKPPFESLGFFATESTSFWPTNLWGFAEGDEHSYVKKMIEFIEASPTSYTHNQTYFLTGHNSNTYIQWVLDHFPEFPGKLPWNAFGKGYKITT
jgi:hypothetical protein